MFGKIKTIDDLYLKNRVTLVRVDLNVPVKDGKVKDDTRIRAIIPTIKKLKEKEAKIVLMSHLGRPEGKRDKAYSLEPVALKLAEILNEEVIFSEETIGDGVKKLAQDLKPGQIMVLENLRFYPEEEKNDDEFSRKLASIGEVYINDAFGTAHRAHASTFGVAKYFKDKGIGVLMEEEVRALSKLLESPQHPYLLILGGAKVSDKVGVLTNLLPKVDSILIGGAMANSFLAAKGFSMGKSKVEEDKIPLVKDIMRKAEDSNVKIVLPIDVVTAKSIDELKGEIHKVEEIPKDEMVLDIGPETVTLFEKEIKLASTIFWNGPMGVFEKEPFSKGTMDICRAIARNVGYTVVGGGDSLAAVNKSGLEKSFSHLSTGGGASLEFLEGKKLPALQALLE